MSTTAAKEKRVEVSDEELITRACSGEIPAFGQLYKRHVAIVYGFLRRCAGNEQEAEDLTQETFILAFRKLRQFRQKSAFSTWPISIAISVFRSQLRSKQRRENRQLAWYQSTTTHHDESGCTDALFDLERAIGTLPHRARMVLILHEINGHTHEEIANIMNISKGTCKAHLNRAKRLIEKRLRQ